VTEPEVEPVVLVVLSVDELRALGRVADVVVPAFVEDDDPADPIVDLAAVRGLMARGLVAASGAAPGDAVRLDDDLAAVLAPARSGRVLAEVDDEIGATGARTWAAVGDDTGASTVVVGHGPGLVTVELCSDAVPAVVAARCGVDEVAAEPEPEGFSVALGAQIAADEAVLDGDLDGAVAALGDAGVLVTSARRWVDVVATRSRAVGVQIARNLGAGPDGPFEAAEVHWLVAADGTAWQLAVDLDDLGPDDDTAFDLDHDDLVDEEPDDVRVVVAPVSREHLRAALVEALRPGAEATTPGGL
jgi:hypothetical protein